MKSLDVVYLHSHDTGRYVQPYGHGAVPVLQELAEQGLLFRSAFCAAPTCGAELGGAVDGQVGPLQRHAGAGAPRLLAGGLPPASGARIGECGYHTVLPGVQHVGTATRSWGASRCSIRTPTAPRKRPRPPPSSWATLPAPEAEQLYDLASGPNEARNLAADRGGAGVLGLMRGRRDQWIKETGDPLLSGPVRAPSGARINDGDGLLRREKPRLIE